MRVITVAVVMIAVLAIGGFTLRHTMLSATAEQAKAQIDPYALQLTIDTKSLPEQKLPGDLFGGPPYP